MIFAQMLTPEAEYENKLANAQNWNGMGQITHIQKPANPEKIIAARRASLISLGCRPIKEATAEQGISFKHYRAMARANKAIMFVMPDGEELVPLWAIQDGRINPIAVQVAKYYTRHKPDGTMVDFCDKVVNRFVAMATSRLYAETGNHQPLSQDFNERSAAKFIARKHENSADRPMWFALTMANGKNKTYVHYKILLTIEELLKTNHTPDSYEKVMQSLNSEPKTRVEIEQALHAWLKENNMPVTRPARALKAA